MFVTSIRETTRALIVLSMIYQGILVSFSIFYDQCKELIFKVLTFTYDVSWLSFSPKIQIEITK